MNAELWMREHNKNRNLQKHCMKEYNNTELTYSIFSLNEMAGSVGRKPTLTEISKKRLSY